jgi:hypothetical protein
MTIEELLARESIRHTMATYTTAGDRLRADDFVAAFTEDGVLESEGVPQQDLFHHRGRAAIREWIARWTRDRPEGVASLPQAMMLSPRAGVSSSEAEANVSSPEATAPPQPTAQSPRATFVRHHLSTCLIDLTGPDTAKARTYWTAYTDIGPDHCGHYIDTFRKVGDRWLIAHRKVRLDWRSPASLFKAAVSRSR